MSGRAGELAEQAHGEGGLLEFIQSIIPDTLFSALTSGNVLQTLFLALITGFAIQAIPRSAADPALHAIEVLQKVVFKILVMILWLAPIGAFGAIANVVARTGWDAVIQLMTLMLGFYITCIIFVFGVLGALLWVVARMSIFKLVRYLAREYLLIVATSSSESALPRLIAKMEHLGVDRSTAGVVVPTGYSFNLDGTAIYLTMASLFIADAMGKPLAIGEQISLLVFMIDRVQGGGRGYRRRAGGAGRRAAEPPARPARRGRPDRRHRPVHVRGPRGHQLLRQRGRHAAGGYVDEHRRQGASGHGAAG